MRIVQRPEPPREEPSEAPRGVKPLPKMSKEEIAAILAVTETNRPTKWGAAGNRAKVIAIPTTLISLLLSLALGTWGMILPIAAAIAWSAWPLVRQKKSGWT